MRLLTLLFILLCALPCWADSTLTITVVNGDTGLPFAARCMVVDSNGDDAYPGTMAEAIYHTAGSRWAAHWYTTGVSELTVPDGATIIGASHGPEYSAFYDTIDVSGATAVACTLNRVVDMNALGWYSSDNHTHIHHAPLDYDLTPSDAEWFAEAEGLNIISCLDNTYEFTGTTDAASTGTTLVWMGEEMRSWKWGHMEVVGTSAVIDSAYYITSWSPFLYTRADTIHAAGGIFIPAHTRSQWLLSALNGNERARELPVQLWKDKIDAVSIASYSNSATSGWELPIWYHALNSGFECPPSAGTDAVANWDTGGAPCGGFRAYTPLPSLDYSAWMDSLSAGRSFVTSGPLFTSFTVNGTNAGGVIANAVFEPVEVSGSFAVTCATPLLRADIIVNGAVDQTLSFAGAATMDTTFAVALTEPAWIAVKVVGEKTAWSTVGDSLEAHTGPVYVTMAGISPMKAGGPARFASWVDSLISVAEAEASWETPEDSTAAFALLDSASVYFTSLYAGRGIYTVGAGGDFADLATALADAAVGPGDTLALLDGTHDLDGCNLYDNMTLRSLSGDPSACIVTNAAVNADAVVADSTATIKGIGFTENAEWNGNYSMIRAIGAGVVTVSNCTFYDISNSTTTCAGVTTLTAQTCDLLIYDCVFDNITGGGNYPATFYYGTGRYVVQNCIIRNCVGARSPVALLHSNASADTARFYGDLFANNRSTSNYGGAVRFNPGLSSGPSVIANCTFDNNEAIHHPAYGQLWLSAGVIPATMQNCIITGSDTTYCIGGTGVMTAINSTDTYGTGRDAVKKRASTFSDTLHVDPDYNSTTAAPGGYQARACALTGPETVGGYWGWADWPARCWPLPENEDSAIEKPERGRGGPDPRRHRG